MYIELNDHRTFLFGPGYIWIARGIVGNKTVIELIFDDTQIATSESCISINVFDKILEDHSSDLSLMTSRL